MANWKSEIIEGAEIVKSELTKAMNGEKLQKNSELVETVATELIENLGKLGATEIKVWGYKDAKGYVTKTYGMSGDMEDHGSIKHKIAVSIAHYMQ